MKEANKPSQYILASKAESLLGKPLQLFEWFWALESLSGCDRMLLNSYYLLMLYNLLMTRNYPLMTKFVSEVAFYAGRGIFQDSHQFLHCVYRVLDDCFELQEFELVVALTTTHPTISAPKHNFQRGFALSKIGRIA